MNCLLLVWLLVVSPRYRCLRVILLIISWTTLVLTKCRGQNVTIMLGMAVMVILSRRPGNKLFLVLFATVVGAALYVGLFQMGVISDEKIADVREFFRVPEGEIEDTLKIRYDSYWSKGIEDIISMRLIGQGPLARFGGGGQGFGKSNYDESVNRHSQLLLIAQAYGIPGLLFWIAFILSAAYAAVTRRDSLANSWCRDVQFSACHGCVQRKSHVVWDTCGSTEVAGAGGRADPAEADIKTGRVLQACRRGESGKWLVRNMESTTLRMPTIVQVCTRYVDLAQETGGVSNSVREICLGLETRGIKTIVVCGNRQRGAPAGPTGHFTVSPFLEMFVVPQRGHPLLGPTGQVRECLGSLREPWMGHVHTCFSALTEAAMGYMRRKGIPYIFTPRGKLSPEFLSQHRLAKSLWWMLCARHAVKDAATIAVQSRGESRGFSSLGLPEKFHVVPNGYRMVGSIESHRDEAKDSG